MIIVDGGLTAARALTEAARLAQMNIPYLWGGNSLRGFDCSGLVQWCYSVGGYPGIPKDVRIWTTASLKLLGSSVAKGSQLPGDLIFPDAGHVGICTSKTQFIDAPETGKTVGLHDFTRYNAGNYTVRRLVDPFVGTDVLVAAGVTGIVAPIVAPITAAEQIIDAIEAPIKWLSEGSNWVRIGMIIGGAALGLFGIVYLEKSS